ncbi:MAG: glycosyltransferase family 2 protein [Bacteroidia bacterium]
MWPLVSIVSVNFNQPELTGLMLASLRQVSYPHIEVIVVDNGSTQGDIRQLKQQFPEITLLISPDNLGFAGGNNLAFPHCRGKYILLLNNDTEVDPGFLEPMVSLMEQEMDVGAVSPKLYFYDRPDTLQYAGTTNMHPITQRGRKYGYGEQDTGQHDRLHETGYANGACMLIRDSLLHEVGYLYAPFFLYYEEHDLCARIRRAGYRIMFQPQSRIWHKVSASTGALSPLKTHYLHRNRLVYLRRNQQGLVRVLAEAYYWLVATPRQLWAQRRSPVHRRAIWQALAWNLRHRHLPEAPIVPLLQPVTT